MSNDTKKYKLLKGSLPNNYNVVILVVGKNHVINDSVLYSLGIKDRNVLSNDLEEIKKNDKYQVNSIDISYDDILGKTYKLILNTDYYVEENGNYVDHSNDSEYMKSKIDSGLDLIIVGIVENEGESSSVQYKSDLTLYLIDKISQTDIYKKQINNQETNVLTGEQFDGINSTYNNVTKKLGIYESGNPSSIKMAKEYYEEFKKQQVLKNSNLKVALIYSYGVNGEDGVIDENSESSISSRVSHR